MKIEFGFKFKLNKFASKKMEPIKSSNRIRILNRGCQSRIQNFRKSFKGSGCLGSGCSTAVRHMPSEQKSSGRGFEFGRVLGFFSLLYPSVERPLFRSLIEMHHY